MENQGNKNFDNATEAVRIFKFAMFMFNYNK